MTVSPDIRVPPIPAGTRCLLDGQSVRVYARIPVGALWDGRYECWPTGSKRKAATKPTYANREQLEVCCG